MNDDDGAKQGDFLGQEKLILGRNETNYGTRQGDFWDRRSQYWGMGQSKVIFWHRRS